MGEPLITLEEAKEHCRVDGDWDDAALKMYIAAALEACQTHIGKRFDEGLIFTPAIKIGCLMYVCQMYEIRTMVSEAAVTEVPFTISNLWNVYRDPGVY